MIARLSAELLGDDLLELVLDGRAVTRDTDAGRMNADEACRARGRRRDRSASWPALTRTLKDSVARDRSPDECVG